MAATSFGKAYNRRAESIFGNTPATFISLEHLLAEKLHWARPQDMADVAVLQRALARA